MKRPTKTLAGLLIAVLLATLFSSTVLAADEPAYGSATVDGAYGDWDLTEDFFADMYRAGDPTKEVESKLYLRYDCDTEILYALVLAEPDVWVLGQPDDAFIKVDNWDPPPPDIKLVDGNSGNDGVPPDFAWVGMAPEYLGWEASAPLPPGSYSRLNVHVQVWDDGESQTSAVQDRGIELTLMCDPVTAVTLASFDAAPSRGTVALNWETATEVDTAGFNLYRARSENGSWTQVNDELIAATGEFASGASYSYVDKPGYGAFLYKLEEVDYDGTATLYDLIMVRVAPLFRRPSRRPMPPRAR
jgi:hypothetical protein